MSYIGVYLLIIFIILIIMKLLIKINKVSANNGSIAIGKNNYGDIKLTNHNAGPKESVFWNAWNIFIGLIGLIGFILTLWPLIK